MRKIIMLTLLFVFIGYSYVIASTTVGGNITEDTVWTESQDPYVITQDVQVLSGAKLTIQAGVTVKFNQNKRLRIDGLLISKGTDLSPITYTSNSNDHSSYYGKIEILSGATPAIYDTEEEYVSGSIIQNCNFTNFGSIFFQQSVFINNNQFINCNRPLVGENFQQISPWYGISNVKITENLFVGNNCTSTYYSDFFGVIYLDFIKSSTIESNVFKDNYLITNGSNAWGAVIFIEGMSSRIKIVNNKIFNNIAPDWLGGGAAAIYFKGNGDIVGNVIIGNKAINSPNANAGGISLWQDGLDTINIFNNLVVENKGGRTGGLYAYTGDISIQKNFIKNNKGNYSDGMLLRGKSQHKFEIYNNDIYDSISLETSTNLSMANNFWGTEEYAVIDRQIYDYYDDINLGIVTYKPIIPEIINNDLLNLNYDRDGDGSQDCIDDCPNDSNKTDPGVCGCGIADKDSDNDGTPGCIDCDDSDPTVYPGATENCNGVDDNCDGQVDEGICPSGDLDGGIDVDLIDATLALQVVIGSKADDVRPDYATSRADINNNNKIGPEEAIYILQKVSQLK